MLVMLVLVVLVAAVFHLLDVVEQLLAIGHLVEVELLQHIQKICLNFGFFRNNFEANHFGEVPQGLFSINVIAINDLIKSLAVAERVLTVVPSADRYKINYYIILECSLEFWNAR